MLITVTDVLPSTAEELGASVLNNIAGVFNSTEACGLRVALEDEYRAVVARVEKVGDSGLEVSLRRQLMKGTSGDFLPLFGMLGQSITRMQRHGGEGQDLSLDSHFITSPVIKHLVCECDEVRVVLLLEIGLDHVDTAQLLQSDVSLAHGHHSAGRFRSCQP
ncbi:hypothetical protein AAMO2058_000699900 [Amorphochlora amoebiformis]